MWRRRTVSGAEVPTGRSGGCPGVGGEARRAGARAHVLSIVSPDYPPLVSRLMADRPRGVMSWAAARDDRALKLRGFRIRVLVIRGDRPAMLQCISSSGRFLPEGSDGPRRRGATSVPRTFYLVFAFRLLASGRRGGTMLFIGVAIDCQVLVQMAEQGHQQRPFGHFVAKSSISARFASVSFPAAIFR